MPNVPQEPLSPLACSAHCVLNILDTPPPSYNIAIGPHHINIAGVMTYYGQHVWAFSGTGMVTDWHDWILFGTTEEFPAQINCTLALTWSAPSLTVNVGIDLYGSHHWESGWFGQTFPFCEAGTPWGLPAFDVTRITGPHTVNFRVWRDLSPLAPFLHAFANSPTVHGSLGNHSVVTGPVYPEGAIYAETPPDRVLTYMRRKALRDFTTHPALLDRQEAFTAAATQWRTLSTQQQANWTAAGRTCRPRVAGYALFTEVLTTKRLDLMRLLEARTGLSLVPPVYPT